MATYPSLGPRVTQIVEQVGSGAVPTNTPDVFVRKHSFYHTITSATGTTNTLFNGTPADNTTNLPGATGLGTDTAFWLQSMSISLVMAPSATAGKFVLANLDLWLAFMLHGLVKLKIGERTVAEFQGVWRAGTGVNLQGLSTDTTTAGAAQQVAMLTAVDPWKFAPWFLILPQKQVSLTIVHPTSVTLSTTFNLRAELHGLLITPSNN